MSWNDWAVQILSESRGSEDGKPQYIKTNTGGLCCDTHGNVWGAAGSLNSQTHTFKEMAAMAAKVFQGGVAAQSSFNFPDVGTPGSLKYMVLQADDSLILAKKGQYGLTIAKHGNLGYIVGCYDESISPGTSNKRVCAVVDMLKGSA